MHAIIYAHPDVCKKTFAFFRVRVYCSKQSLKAEERKENYESKN